MDILSLVFVFCFLIRTLRNSIYHLFWWYLKEYRFDRMIVHLRETYQGRRWLFGRLSIAKWMALAGILVKSGITQTIVFSIYLLEGGFNLFELRKGWKKPPFRPKSLSLLLIILATQIILLNFLPFGLFLNALITDKLLGLTTALLVFFINIPFYFYKKWKIKKARLKIRNYPNLLVIGITGSFAKTTTKEFIAQILSQKFKVLKTIGSQNTDIGIAEIILNTDLSSFDVFVCEMAAYKKGEIREICSMVKPNLKIGVITGINEQHQSLFGSLENTVQAKFELVEALPKKGLAFFNGKNKYCLKMAEQARKKGLIVKVIKERWRLSKVDLPGEHNLENLFLAIAVVREFGLKDNQIKEAIKKIKLPPKTMKIIKKKKLILINDTFNANPDGVFAALKFLDKQKGKKILVLQPLIELGKYANRIHEKIGEKAALVCDEIILTNRNFHQGLIKGVEQVSKGKEKVKIEKPISQINKGVILFEEKEAERYLNEFLISNS